MDTIAAAREAIDNAGGPRSLAAQLHERNPGITLDRLIFRVEKWRYQGIPPRWVPQVAEITGRALHELRPDVHRPTEAA